MSRVFENRKAVLLTKHGKGKAIRLPLEQETGCELVIESGFDTDRLGTFSREIKRPKSQLETARLKIRKGMKLTNIDIGIASEGSFGSHPFAPVPWNVELVLLFDKKHKMEIFGIYEGTQTNVGHLQTDDFESILSFAGQIGFPEHWLILRPDDEFSKSIIKDIDSVDKLKEAFYWCLAQSQSGKVFVETDMRAHANPTRMKNIEEATRDLLSKLMSLCPECSAPGFIIKQVIKGLPCEQCGLASEMALKRIYTCHRCKHKREDMFPAGQFAPAERCDFCNP